MKMAGQRGRLRLTATEGCKELPAYVHLGAFKGADATPFTGSFAGLSPQKLQSGVDPRDRHTVQTQVCDSLASPALIYHCRVYFRISAELVLTSEAEQAEMLSGFEAFHTHTHSDLTGGLIHAQPAGPSDGQRFSTSGSEPAAQLPNPSFCCTSLQVTR